MVSIAGELYKPKPMDIPTVRSSLGFNYGSNEMKDLKDMRTTAGSKDEN